MAVRVVEGIIADETSSQVLAPGNSPPALRPRLRFDRLWGGPDPRGVAYRSAPHREAGNLIGHLAAFPGTLPVGGYKGNRAFTERNAVRSVFCALQVLQTGPIRTGSDRDGGAARIAELCLLEGETRGRNAPQKGTRSGTPEVNLRAKRIELRQSGDGNASQLRIGRERARMLPAKSVIHQTTCAALTGVRG